MPGQNNALHCLDAFLEMRQDEHVGSLQPSAAGPKCALGQNKVDLLDIPCLIPSCVRMIQKVFAHIQTNR